MVSYGNFKFKKILLSQPVIFNLLKVLIISAFIKKSIVI
jgi:hypothetical protein